MYYIRKFLPGPWRQYDYKNTQKISSEAITISLQAKGNELSFWKADSLDLIEEQGLLSLLGGMDNLDKIDVLIFTDEELENLGLILKDSPGVTKLSGFRDFHTNIVELDLVGISEFAHLFAQKIFDEETKQKEFDKKINEANQKKKSNPSHYEALIKGLEDQKEKLLLRRYRVLRVKEILKKAIDNKALNIDKDDLGDRILNKLT